MDLNDWLCIKCQAQPKRHISLCGRCFNDFLVEFLGALVIAVVVVAIMAGLLWWPITWIWWLAG